MTLLAVVDTVVNPTVLHPAVQTEVVLAQASQAPALTEYPALQVKAFP